MAQTLEPKGDNLQARMAQLYEQNKTTLGFEGQFTPKQLLKAYPELNTSRVWIALNNVVKDLVDDPIAQHIKNFIYAFTNMRGAEYTLTGSEILYKIYRKCPREEYKQNIIDTVLYFCKADKLKAAFLEEYRLLGIPDDILPSSYNKMNEEVTVVDDIFSGKLPSVDDIEYIISRYSAALSRVHREYSTTTISNRRNNLWRKEMMLQEAVETFEFIKLALEERYSELFDSLQIQLNPRTPVDTIEEFLRVAVCFAPNPLSID